VSELDDLEEFAIRLVDAWGNAVAAYLDRLAPLVRSLAGLADNPQVRAAVAASEFGSLSLLPLSRERTPAMRIATNPLEADAEVLDPANPGPFIALAGPQFLAMEGDSALVRLETGCVIHAHPGWLAVRADGAGDGEVFFASPQGIGGPASIWRATGD